MFKKIIKYFLGSFFATIAVIISFFILSMVISHAYNYFTKENYQNYQFTVIEKPVSYKQEANIQVNLTTERNKGEYRYILNINPSERLSNNAIIYSYKLKEKDTLKTIYSIEKVISPSNISFANLYMKNKTYLLEVKFYYLNNPNNIAMKNYEILPKNEL
ncbi:MAG: hypothetical protein GX282_06235 [Campylobacteraceae bacterium]|nr:hypothetical protein [Campylobacteraceae bacterium]